MYEKFYHFREKPFQLVPNPYFLFKSEKHKNALTYLEYGLMENVGYIVLTGEVGSGKTITVEYMLNKMKKDFETAVIFNTSMSAEQILYLILIQFGVTPNDHDKAHLIEALNLFLMKKYEEERRVLLVVDEAQNLSLEVLEEFRMLSNLKNEHSSLMQVMLVGQPMLLSNLRNPAMEQLRQRIAVHFHLTALDRKETAGYISHRLMKAGGKENLFTSAAMDMIYDLSKGIPRAINLLCQGALVYAFADEASSISQDIIKQITQDHIGVSIEPCKDNIKIVMQHEKEKIKNKYNINKRLNALEDAVKDLRVRIKNRSQHQGKELDEPYVSMINDLKVLLEEERKRNRELLVNYTKLERRFNDLKEMRIGKYGNIEKLKI